VLNGAFAVITDFKSDLFNFKFKKDTARNPLVPVLKELMQ